MKALVRLNDLEIPVQFAEPGSRLGEVSGKPRCQLAIALSNVRPNTAREIDLLLKAKTLSVYDPFEERSYEASTSRSTKADYYDGEAFDYSFTVDEIDPPLTYESVEASGETIPVLRHRDRADPESTTVDVLVRVTSEQLVRLMEIDTSGSGVPFRRVGIDEQPWPCFRTRLVLWSRHEERLKATLHVSSAPLADYGHPIAGHPGIQEANFRDIRAFKMRFEALLGVLQERGILSSEDSARLLAPDWTQLGSPERVKEINRDTLRVADAEEHF